MAITIIVAGNRSIAYNVLNYLIGLAESTPVSCSYRENGVSPLRDKNKIPALPNENDDGIDNWQHYFKRTALDNNIEMHSFKRCLYN